MKTNYLCFRINVNQAVLKVALLTKKQLTISRKPKFANAILFYVWE